MSKSAGKRFDTGRLNDWYRRVGTSPQLGSASSRHLHRSGAGDAANYMPTFVLEPHDGAENFDEYLFWRPLSFVLTYVLLRTPSTMHRTTQCISEYNSDFVLFGTTDSITDGFVTSDDRQYSFTYSNPLAALSMSETFSITNTTTAEYASVWVPADMINDADLAEADPVMEDSPLSRATVFFLRNFAYDVAVRGADVELDAEMAAIDLLRSTLNPHRSRETYTVDSPAVLRERVTDAIDRNYRNPDFDAESLAGLLHLSRRQLYRRLAEFDESPAEMIAQRRLDRARELIARGGSYGLSGIAHASGFSSVATLRNRFTARYGITPLEYAREVSDGW